MVIVQYSTLWNYVLYYRCYLSQSWIYFFYQENFTAIINFKQYYKSDQHRRRIKTEEKANVVTSVWGKEFIQFLAALAVLTRTIYNNRMNCNRMISKTRINSSHSSKSSKAEQLAWQGILIILPPIEKWRHSVFLYDYQGATGRSWPCDNLQPVWPAAGLLLRQLSGAAITYRYRPTKQSLPLTKLTDLSSEWKVG